jgi:hypothetical protein
MKDINEDLNIVKQEPESKTNKKAKRMGLSYVGFNRYEDPKTQQVTHILQNDSLVPFNKAVKSNTFRTQNMDDVGTYNQIMSQQVQQIHELLVAQYSPEKYDDKELDAIYNFTSGAYADINSRLSTLPADVPANKIEPNSVDDPLPDFVVSMDSAVKKTRSPIDFLTYANLGSDVDLNTLGVGASFKFKGYRDTSINLGSVINPSITSQTSGGGRTQVAILQIQVKKNSRGIYASDFSANAEDFEFILPRGAKIEIVNGPQKLVGSDAMTQNLNLEIVYYDCVLKA